MSKKNSALINTVAILSLIIFGYLLFFTVYRQMISQNEGFFYVIVFGGILVLVYILLSLMTKLLAFSAESESNSIFIVLEIIFILIMSFLFVKLRINYSTSVPAEESTIYHTAKLVNEGSLSVGGMSIFPQLLNCPQTYITGYFLSFIFKLTQADPKTVVYFNTGLLLATALTVFAITRRLSSRICSLMALLICLYMPTFGFSVYSFNAQIMYALVLSLSLLLTIIPITQTKAGTSTIIYVILAGILWGISLSMVPAGLLILIIVLLLSKSKVLDRKLIGLLIVIAVLEFLGLAYLKSLTLELSFGEIMTGFLSSCNPFISETGDKLDFMSLITRFNDKLDSHQLAINDNYYFLSGSNGATYSAVRVAWLQLGNQLLYMFIIILSIACSFYMIRSKNRRAVPILSAILASFLIIFLCSKEEYNIVFFVMLLTISGTISLQYMYENHHQLADENFREDLEDESEEIKPSENEEEVDEAAFMLRAQALIFIGANDAYYMQIKQEEMNNRQNRANRENNVAIAVVPDTTDNAPVEYLETPLPMPPKHVHKDLDFDNDFDNGDDDFSFDFDINPDDESFNDFDIE